MLPVLADQMVTRCYIIHDIDKGEVEDERRDKGGKQRKGERKGGRKEEGGEGEQEGDEVEREQSLAII